MTLDLFNLIPVNEIFRTVITKYHHVEPNNPFFTFICKKEENNKWAIYYDFTEKGPAYVSEHGKKLLDKDEILLIFPCNRTILELYLQ